MRIRVDEIPDSGRKVHFHWDQERLSQFLPPDDPFELELVQPVDVDLEIQTGIDHLKIHGSIKGSLQVACHRCLKPFTMTLAEEVDVVLVAQENLPEDEETEDEDDDELDHAFFDGEIIDVDQLVAEQIFLALPFKVLCSEECRGLCPKCGANLNDEDCMCDRGSGHSPFAGLQALKGRLPRD